MHDIRIPTRPRTGRRAPVRPAMSGVHVPVGPPTGVVLPDVDGVLEDALGTDGWFTAARDLTLAALRSMAAAEST